MSQRSFGKVLLILGVTFSIFVTINMLIPEAGSVFSNGQSVILGNVQNKITNFSVVADYVHPENYSQAIDLDASDLYWMALLWPQAQVDFYVHLNSTPNYSVGNCTFTVLWESSNASGNILGSNHSATLFNQDIIKNGGTFNMNPPNFRECNALINISTDSPNITTINNFGRVKISLDWHYNVSASITTILSAYTVKSPFLLVTAMVSLILIFVGAWMVGPLQKRGKYLLLSGFFGFLTTSTFIIFLNLSMFASTTGFSIWGAIAGMIIADRLRRRSLKKQQVNTNSEPQ